jgi:hypothetical protein
MVNDMGTYAAELRRTERWMGLLVPKIFRRVLKGKAPQPGWLPRRWQSVISADVDMDSGVGAVWPEWRPRSALAQERIALIERYGGRWDCGGTGSDAPGGAAPGRLAVGHPGQFGVTELGGDSGGDSGGVSRA